MRGIDAARGLALLGMIAAHTLPTSDDGGLTTVGLLAGGTSAALFGLLVGVSVALLTGRRHLARTVGTSLAAPGEARPRGPASSARRGPRWR